MSNQKSQTKAKNFEETFKVNFNQEYSSLSVISNNSFKLFSLSGVDKVDEIFSSEPSASTNVNVKIVERLFSSSLIAIVNYNEQNKLKMCHFKKRSDICEFKYPKHILNVAMNRNRLVVCLKDSIYIHNIQDMKLLHSIKNIMENPNGLISLSSKNCLAYPIATDKGRIQLFDANKAENGVVIDAHSSKVVIMKFSSCGDMLATASEKGTVIRIFSVQTGTLLIEFRRSVKRYAQISSLNFSICGKYVTCSSNTDTIHIFKIESKSNMFSFNRAFATVQLNSDARKHCVIARLDGQLSLLAACDDGFLYIYGLGENGGECSLIRVHDLRADLDFARIGGSESLEALALEESLKEKKDVETDGKKNNEEDNPIVKSSYADIIKKAGTSPEDNQKMKKGNKKFQDHDNFKYEEGCRV